LQNVRALSWVKLYLIATKLFGIWCQGFILSKYETKRKQHHLKIFCTRLEIFYLIILNDKQWKLIMKFHVFRKGSKMHSVRTDKQEWIQSVLTGCSPQGFRSGGVEATVPGILSDHSLRDTWTQTGGEHLTRYNRPKHQCD
jgi:hypothetical protein